MLVFFPDQYSCSDSVIWHLQSGQRTPTVYHFQVIHLLGQVPKTSSNSLYFIYHYQFSHANNYGLNFSTPYAPENQCFKQNIISCMFLTSSVNKFQQQQKKHLLYFYTFMILNSSTSLKDITGLAAIYWSFQSFQSMINDNFLSLYMIGAFISMINLSVVYN